MFYSLCYRRSCSKRQSVVILGSPARGRHSPTRGRQNPVGQQVLPFDLSCSLVSASCVVKAEVKWRLDNDHKQDFDEKHTTSDVELAVKSMSGDVSFVDGSKS